MRNRIWLVFLILGILFVFSGFLFSFFEDSLKKNPIDNSDSIVTVEASYSCSQKTEKFNGQMNGSFMEFEFHRYYHFSYQDNEILYATRGVHYQFPSLDIYKKFEWSKESSNTLPDHVEEDLENLVKNYSWSTTILKENDSDGLNEYLDYLSKLGYTCKKIGE